MPAAEDLTAKHEKFAQELAKGTSACAAYAAAGFRAHAGNASRLSANENVRRRVAEIQAAGADRAEITIQWVLAGLRENYERAMQVRPAAGADGETLGTYRYDGAVANKALELIGKHLGMFVDRQEVRMGLLDDLNVEERDTLPGAIKDELIRRTMN